MTPLWQEESALDSPFIHRSSYIDDRVSIGSGTKIWHFCHIQTGAVIGENCTLGQNVNISNRVIIGNGVKIQNNVSVYEGVEIEDDVFLGPSCVFTNDLTPRAGYPKGPANYVPTLVRAGASSGRRESSGAPASEPTPPSSAATRLAAAPSSARAR